MRLSSFLGLVAIGLTACAGGSVAAPSAAESPQVHSAVNPAASFDHYRTFSLGPAEAAPAGYQGSPRSAEVRRRLTPVISAALAGKGYTEATGKGDLLVLFGSGRREVAIPQGSSSVTAEWLPDDEDTDFVEGALVIDVYDGATGVRVWHGASRASINPARPDDTHLDRSAMALLANFPSAKPGA